MHYIGLILLALLTLFMYYIQKFNDLFLQLNYKQDFNKVLEEANSILKNKIIEGSYVFGDGNNYKSICFNIRFDELGDLNYDFMDINDNGDITIEIENDDLLKMEDQQFDSINLKGKSIELKLKSGQVYEYNIDKNELKLTHDPTKQPEDSELKILLINFASEWMNYSDHPKYDTIKHELDLLYKNINSNYKLEKLIMYLNNIFSLHSLDQEFKIGYNDFLGLIYVNKIETNEDQNFEKQKGLELTLAQKAIVDFRQNFSDNIISEKIVNAIGTNTIDQALQPLNINGETSPSALTLLMKDKEFINSLKDENNMIQLEKLFNTLIC